MCAAVAAEAERRIRDLLGDPLDAPPGVLHVASVWQSPEERLLTLRIGPDSPRSRTDRFLLDLARARCDAIVTTGKILRAETDVEHRLSEDLAAWRREVRGLERPPLSVVLTTRADLDPAHPLLANARQAVVVTTQDAASRLARSVASERVEVVARDAPSLRDTLDFLQAERGLASVCIEAGPSSSRSLYEDPLCVDELMLGVFLGDWIPDAVRGEAFAEPTRLARCFDPVCESKRQEESGPWLFRRLVR